MKKLIPTILASVLSLFAIHSSIAQDANKNPEFANAQKIYEEQLFQIAVTYGEKTKAVLADYIKDLDILEKAMTKQGNLKGVLAVRQDKADFEAANNITDATDQTPAELKTLKEKHKSRIAAMELDKKKEIERLTALYIGRLEKIQIALTKATKIDEALTVNSEIEKVKGTLGLKPADNGGATDQPPQTAVKPGSKKPAQLVIPAGLREGLILHYSFDQDEGDKIKDKSGQKNHGKVVGATWKEDDQGNGMIEFDGQDDWIETSLCLSRFNRATFSAWVKAPKVQPLGIVRAIMAQPKTTQSGGFAIGFIDRALRSACSYQSGSYIDVAGPAIHDDLLHHIAGTVGEGNLSLYLDGKLVARKAYQDEKVSADEYLSIGRQFSDSSAPAGMRCFLGQIAEVMAWKRVLSEQEVEELYKAAGRVVVDTAGEK